MRNIPGTGAVMAAEEVMRCNGQGQSDFVGCCTRAQNRSNTYLIAGAWLLLYSS
jgi:hypothetical protein